MNRVDFPEKFPEKGALIEILRKTIDKAWKVDLDIKDIERWLNNFKGLFFDAEDEQRIALWMLCNFTYYNNDEVIHLCRILFNTFLHRIIVENNFNNEKEISKHINSIFFSPVGRAGESGNLILYHFRQVANISADRFFYPLNIDSTEEDIIVFIDDISMSGGTLARFYHNYISAQKYKEVYYLTILASTEAVEKIEKLGIKMIYCILLDERNKCFSENSMVFLKYHSLIEPAKIIAEGYGKIIEPKKPLGHNNGQYCFGFSYNIPNNSLPIFWSSNNWCPIFVRKEKIENAKQHKRKYSKFI